MNSRSTNRDADAYRRAAKLMEKGQEDYACNAIWSAGHRREWSYPQERDRDIRIPRFAVHFQPKRRISASGTWFGLDLPSNRNRRIVALCFMAAMVEAGDA